MELHTRTDEDLDTEVTTEVYTYKNVTIPIGFSSDGASTPRVFWGIIPPFKRTKKSAFVHDFNCREAKNSRERKEADKMFEEMLREVSNISPIRCKLGYWGVRIGALLGVGVRYPHWTDNIKRLIRSKG